jgi:hypothetical protein
VVDRRCSIFDAQSFIPARRNKLSFALVQYSIKAFLLSFDPMLIHAGCIT